MTSQAIPQNDKALLAAQAKAGQAGVDAYQAAKDEMAADQQQVLQHATQAAQARGGPAQASGLVASQANDAYNKGQAQLSRGQANTAARSAGRQESMNLYNEMVLGSRSLIEDQAEAASLMINTQSEADVASIRREGESNVNSINSQMELEAAQFEQAMRQQEKDAQLEQSRWEREMEQRERLARMSAAASGGGGDEGRKATQSEIKAALAQGGVARLNEVAGSLGARVDQANITDEALEFLYTGSMEQQTKYSTTANQIFAPLLDNGMSARDIAQIGWAWDKTGKIDDESLYELAKYNYRQENPNGPQVYDPEPEELDPFINSARYEINDLLGELQIKANQLIDQGLKSANSTGVQITKNDLDFGNLKPQLGAVNNRNLNAAQNAEANRYTALASSYGAANWSPAAPPAVGRDLQAQQYEDWGSGNNAWLGDMSFDPVTGEQDRLNRELEYSTRDLYANDESMRPFLDTLMNSARGFDDIANEQGLSESRMIEQILGMRAPDEFNLDDYSPAADGRQIYTDFLRANPGMADGSGAETARLMFQEAMSGADPAYWDALNVSQEDLIPYMQMGRQELIDTNYLDASGASQNGSLSDLYKPKSFEDMSREQREINASDNEYYMDEADQADRLSQLSDNSFIKYANAAANSLPNYNQLDDAGKAEAILREVKADAKFQASKHAGLWADDFEGLFRSPEQMIGLLNADYSDTSAEIEIGIKNDDSTKNYIGLSTAALNGLIKQELSDGIVKEDATDPDNLRYFTTLDNVLIGLNDTFRTHWNEVNYDAQDYEAFLTELGLNNQGSSAQQHVMYSYMQLFKPGRVPPLSMNSNLPPYSGQSTTIDLDG